MRSWLFAAFAVVAGTTLVGTAAETTKVTIPRSAVLASWKGEELAVWTQKVYRCTNTHIAAEGLSATSIGPDPQLGTVLKKPFEGKCNQYVEVVLRSAVVGRCQLFWESEKYGKCTEERSAAFNVTKAGEWATFKVCPCWVGEGRITSLRIDPPDALRGTFELKSVSVFEEGDDAGIDTCKFTGVAFDAVTPDISFASLTWKTDTSPGWKLLGFTTPSDGRRHTYWFDFKNPHNLKYRFAGKDAWTGTAYSLRPMCILANRPLPVENLRLLTDKPDLPPDVGVTYVGPELAIPRAGRPLALELILRNYGTVAARNIRFALEGLPNGCRVLDAADLAPDGEIGACEGWDSVGDHRATGQLPNERRFRVTLSDLGVGRHSFRLAISADGMVSRSVPVVAELLPSLGLAKADYVPEPKPVRTGRFEIGAFLFPGWDTALWHGVWTRTPIRKPVLGWYDETNPEVVDWQIKHLVENGFSFVFVDWYWDRGRQWHNHWPTVFGKARYRHLLKWSLMWANHNGPGSHSKADQEKVTRFWIDNFFRDPQYMLQDGKPVVSIYLPRNMERDVGPGGCRKLLDISRRVAREAGFPGIHFIAVRLPSGFTNREFLKQFEEYGFDGTCVYKYMGEGNPMVQPSADGFLDYKGLAETSLDHWRTLRANSRLPFLPSLTTAYDDRAWRGEKSSPVKNINAADFKRICEDAKKFSAETGVTRFLTGPIDEWGEGSIGYPNRERGFGMFEAVRDTFGEKPAGGWPLNYAPEDVGLGPYLRADDPLREQPAQSAADTRPYEFRLVDRKQDFREPCDGFENTAGWRVEATDAEASFDCNSSHMLFGAKTGELKYRGTGPKPVVKLLPKEAILATETDTDSLTVWVRGNHFGHGANRQFDTPSPGLFASLRLKDGNVRKYKLANTIWLDWHLVAFRLPQADLKKGIDAFLGFSLEGEMQEEFLPLHFDNLALFHDRRGPLSVPQRARRNIKPLPDADQGVNTGSGTLPFPIREETVLPVAKRDDTLEFSCAEGTDGPDFRVSFAGSEPASIFADGGVKAIVSAAGRAVKPVKAKRMERRADGGDTVERWLYSATDAESIVVYTYRRMGNSMVVDMRAEKGVVAEMSVGDMGDAKVRTSFIVPYLAYGPNAVQGNNPRRAPIVAFDVTGRDGKPATLFRYAAGDWYRSNASSVDGAEGASGRMTQRFRYLPKSDGKRVPLSERIFINISTKVDEVLPTIPNPPSPLKHITGKRLWRAHASSESRERDKFFWRTLHRYGITEVVVNDHETMWRDGGESYTFRTSFAEGKGGDKGQYEYTRFMRDELGYVYGPYDNFWDYAPVNPNFTFDNVALTSDGSYMTSWMRCYAPKAVTAPWWSEQIVPQVQRKMRFNTCYCDCHTAGSPWGRTDYDARVPGAATFSAAFYAFGDLLLCQRRDWDGPIYSEGAIRYLYAGLVDGNYADDRGYAFQSQPWIVDFDLLRIHPLECDFGMGTMSMFYPDNITLKERRYYLPHFNSVAEREEILDRYLAATVAFGHNGFLVAEYCFDPPRTFGPAYGPTAFGKFAFEDGLPIAWRSYYMIQAAAARYTQSNVAEIGYVNAEGEVERTSKAVLDGTVARDHVFVRYEDGTEVASNGSRKERMRVRMSDGTFDLPPCGYRVRTADGKVLVECSDAGGRKADYAESQDYIYIDGRGGMVVRAKAKSDGPAVCRILKDGYEIIPLGGAKCAFRISGGKATALDIDGKAIGTAETEVEDGWLSVRPVPGAVSYKIGR